MSVMRIALVLSAAAVVAGCSDRGLRSLDAKQDGPDEFLILPAKPLEAPENYTNLPVPTPGSANLTDQNPKADAIVALGGRPSSATSVPSSDAALVQQAGRYGVSSDIRPTLAEADADFRRRQGRFSRFRLLPVDRYEQIYSRQTLDPFSESDRFRRAGIQTPPAPPAE